MNPILIGTGFYSDEAGHPAACAFLRDWFRNTAEVSGNIIIADNSEIGLAAASYSPARIIRINRNLGHMKSPLVQGNDNRLLGWSMSWIMPALMAYSEGCDFIYKEQDCLAFGDWLPAIRKGRICVGHNSVMPCEQSLFYIHHDAILDCVADYMAINRSDSEMSSEDKMERLGVEFHGLPFGRERPIDFNHDGPWYAQKWTDDEMKTLLKTDIQGWFDFANIYDRAVADAAPNDTLIELGVWKGKSLRYLARIAMAAKKNLRVIGIDNWTHTDWDGYASIQQLDRLHGEFRSPFEQCRANLESAGVLDYVTLIKSDSIAAASLFQDKSVRFIFVDDTHNSAHIEKELHAWLPKIKRPSWIAGHDYPGLIYDGVKTVLPHAKGDGNSWIATIE